MSTGSTQRRRVLKHKGELISMRRARRLAKGESRVQELKKRAFQSMIGKPSVLSESSKTGSTIAQKIKGLLNRAG